jgi:hypothetical protein
MSGRILILLIAALSLHATGYATDDKYSPFTSEENNARKSRPANNNTKTEITCKIEDLDNKETHLRIYLEGKLIHDEECDYHIHYSGEPIIADLDGNGLDDIVQNWYRGSQGLLLGCELIVLSQYEKGKFKKYLLPAERFGSNDVFDIDNDGKFEFVTCALVNLDQHNYWVYRCWRIVGDKIVSVDKQCGFPRAIWFTEKPNRKLVDADLLSDIMKNYPKLDLEKKKAEQPPSADGGASAPSRR